MIFRQYLNQNTGCASYLAGCAGHGLAAVVDPQYEVDRYLADAERYHVRIVAVVDTHVHADHRTGNRRLAKSTGATLYLGAGADVTFSFAPLNDGTEIDLGNVRLLVVATPGHTPESISLLIVDRTRADEPWAALTGDTLFVGDVGRPDLGGPAATPLLYASLQRLLELKPYVEVYPAHFSGSPCGAAMSGKPSSTIGFERAHNPLLRDPDAAGFRAALESVIPAKPMNMEELVALNTGRSS